MADNTKIEWADATVNAINGCSVTSPGCTNCYAMKLAGTRMKSHPTREGLTIESKAGPVWNGEVRLHEPALRQPLSWTKPRRIFWNAHGDTFHDAVPDEWIDRVFAVAALTPQHTHMILTKRSKRMRDYLCTRAGDWMLRWPDANPAGSLQISRHEQRLRMQGTLDDSRSAAVQFPLPNVWLGVSVEDQTRADERIPDLLATPAAVRFLSCEPLLGPVDLTMIDITVSDRLQREPSGLMLLDALTGLHRDAEESIEGILGSPDPKIDWVIAGGESGSGARPMHPDWARSLRDQCAAAGVPFHFKQWGEWELSLDRDKDDPDWRADYTNDYVHKDKSNWLNLAGGSGFHGERFVVMRKVGKKSAGRLLDCVEHNGMPGGSY